MSRSRALLWCLAVVVAIAPYVLNLGATSLVDANESFYAETPREMLEAGDFVSPSFNYLPRFNKPPLSYWIVELFYQAFGVSEGIARVPIALGALVLIATSGALGWMLFGREAGVLAGVMLATSPRVLMVARRIIIDVYVSMFLGLAVACFVASELHAARRRRYLLAMYVAVGLGFLTKGPIAIVLPAVSLTLYLMLHGQLRRWREFMPGTGLIVMAAIAIPWYAAVYWQHGWDHIVTFFFDDNIRRFTEGYGAPTPRRGLFFYVPVLLGAMFPWSTVLPIALVWCVRRRIRFGRAPGDASPAARRSALTSFLAIWILVVVAFFSASASKQELYILPVLPAAAALMGGLLASTLQGGDAPYRPAGRAALFLSAILLGACGVAVQYGHIVAAEVVSLAGADAIAFLAMTGGAAAAVAVVRRRDQAAIAALVVSVAAAQWIFVLGTLPDFERYKPIPPLARTIQAQASPAARIGYYRLASPSMVFYLRRPIFEYFDEQQLVDLFSSSQDVYCVMTAGEYAAISSKLSPSYVLARRPMLDVRLRTLMSETPVTDVLLVSNRQGSEVPTVPDNTVG